MAIDVTDQERRAQYAGSGNGPYQFDFECIEETDIAVYQDDTLLALTTHYTVSLNADGTGSVTTVASMTGSTVTIVGARPYERITDYSTGGDFFATSVNDELDSFIILLQQLREILARTLKLPTTTELEGDAAFPEPEANQLIGWNSTGTGLVNLSLQSEGDLLVSSFVETLLNDVDAAEFLATLGVSAFVQTILDDANAAAVRTTIGAVGLTGDETVAGAKTFSGTVTVAGALTPQGLLDVSGASAGQIKFPATQNASADANTLDDYEEGTWTPSLGGTTTYTVQSGTYTKIGRTVHVTARLQINAIGTGSLTVISGAPFTAGATQAIGVTEFGGIATNIVYMTANITATSIALRSMTAAAATLSANSIFQNAASVQVSGVYYV